MNSSKSLRFDLIFSYWIFAWFIMYANDITTYSPKFAFIIGMVENIFLLTFMIYMGVNKTKIVHFVMINTIIKVLPLLYLKNEQVVIKDIYFTIVLFIMFIFWLQINNQNIVDNVKIIFDSYFDDTKKSPSMLLFDHLQK
jgi:hypothetical protein